MKLKKSRIRETLNLSTDANGSTDTIFFAVQNIFFLRRSKKKLREGPHFFCGAIFFIFLGGGSLNIYIYIFF